MMDLPEPNPGPGQIKVKVAACGICGVDAHAYMRDLARVGDPMPIGHEFSGTVAACGEGVTGFEIGQPVACEPFFQWCGECEMCRRDQVNNCRQHRDVGFGPHGAMADYIVIPARGAHKLPAGMNVEDGAIIEPMAATYNVVYRDSETRPGDRVVVLGCGPVGILAAVHAMIGGAEVLLSGWKGDDYRLNKAREMGIQHVINSAETDVVALAAEWTGPDGPSLIVDAAGGSITFDQALEMAGPCCQITKIGWFEDQTPKHMNAIVAKNLRVHGVYGQTYDAWEKCVRLISAGKMPMEHLITHRLALEEWEKGFDLAASRQTVKTILRP